ncbi:MAG: DUF4129 domain-containing protein [Rhodothermales bacterium]|nr:DUF4129 domain-containing protein [Rhodothermales bacterium]
MLVVPCSGIMRTHQIIIAHVLSVLFFVCAVAVATPLTGSAQGLPADTSTIDVRPIPSELRSFQNDERFDYTNGRVERPSPFAQLFRKRFGEFWDRLFESGLGRPLLWLIAAAILFFAIYLITGSGPRGVFYRRARTVQSAVVQEDLEIDNFAERIQAAEQQSDFREAVRLRFVRSLKALADREWIQWTREKTNRAYVFELTRSTSDTQLHDSFAQAAHWFDICWYGHRSPDASLYTDIDRTFTVLESQVDNLPKPAVQT